MKRKIFYPIALVTVLALVLFACRKETVDVFVESVALDMSTATLNVNGTLTLVASVEPDDAFNQFVKWTSSKPSVATVNNAGVVTALLPGETTIIVTTEDGGFSATCTVTVIRQATGITISPKPLSLTVGSYATLTATFSPPDASNQTVTWSSDNPGIATVDSNTGMVTAQSIGTTTIRATSQQDATKSDNCTVTVTKAIVPVVAVTLDQSSASLTTGEKLTLTATVYPTNPPATDPTISWSSTKPAVASVNNKGEVTAIAPGNAIIVVTTTDGQFEAFCNVTVNSQDIPVASISINESSPLTLELDPNPSVKPTPTTLLYTILPADATNKDVVWTSSNPSVADVDDSGNVTPKTVGTTVISLTAVDGSGKTATCIVKVEIANEPVLSVSLPATLTINGSETKTLTASILPLAATNKNVTWESSDETVAIVDGTGLTVNIIPVPPNAGDPPARTTTITVTSEDDNSITATCTVTVNYVAVTGVTVTPTTLTKNKNQQDILTAVIAPANASIKTVEWNSSAPTVVFVDEEDGTITALASGGPVTITATSVDDNTKKGTCAVTVN